MGFWFEGFGFTVLGVVGTVLFVAMMGVLLTGCTNSWTLKERRDCSRCILGIPLFYCGRGSLCYDPDEEDPAPAPAPATEEEIWERRLLGIQ